MTGRIAALIVLACLAGCAAKPVTPPPVMVDRPVKVACIDTVPVKPIYQFGVGERPSGKMQAALLAADFEAAEKYGQEWEAAAAGCLTMAPPKPTQAQ